MICDNYRNFRAQSNENHVELFCEKSVQQNITWALRYVKNFNFR